MAKCRKVLAMLVSLVMVFSLFGLSAFAAEAEGECTLTVNFVDAEGNPIQDPEVTVYPIGSMYEVIAPAIDGHGFDRAEGETSSGSKNTASTLSAAMIMPVTVSFR